MATNREDCYENGSAIPREPPGYLQMRRIATGISERSGFIAARRPCRYQRVAAISKWKREETSAHSSCPACAHIALTIACMSTLPHRADLRNLTCSATLAMEDHHGDELGKLLREWIGHSTRAARTPSDGVDCDGERGGVIAARRARRYQRVAEYRKWKEETSAYSSCPACAHIALTIASMSTHPHHADWRNLT